MAKKIARHHVKEELQHGAHLPGVPARELTEEEYNALPDWMKQTVDKSPLYKGSKPTGWKETVFEVSDPPERGGGPPDEPPDQDKEPAATTPPKGGNK